MTRSTTTSMCVIYLLHRRHIELDGDSHGPKGRELLEDLLAGSPHRAERALQAACSSIEARIGLWNSIEQDRNGRRVEHSSPT